MKRSIHVSATLFFFVLTLFCGIRSLILIKATLEITRDQVLYTKTGINLILCGIFLMTTLIMSTTTPKRERPP